MKVLVTGASGFIGAHLVSRLNRLHHSVRTCDRRTRTAIPVQELTDDDINGVDVVVHLAATARLGISLKEPEAVIENNVTAVLRLLEHCRIHPATKLIYISSSSVKFADLKKNPYALSKAMGEQLVELYRETYQVNATSVRLFNVYGPGEADYGPNTTLIKQCKKALLDNKNLYIDGDGTVVRDFTHVDDVIDGIIAIFYDLHCLKSVYELGSGSMTVSVKDIVTEFQKGTNLSIEYRPARIGDPPSTCADIKLCPGNWKPKINILDHIRDWKNKGYAD